MNDTSREHPEEEPRRRLNGWQRLWIVVVLIYGAVVMPFGISESWPDEAQIHSDWLIEIVEVFATNLSGNASISDVRKAYPEMGDREIVSAVLAKARSRMADSTPRVGDDVTFLLIDAEVDRLSKKYETRFATLGDEKRHAIIVTTAAWLIPMAVLYALGWSVGWIRRGFRGPQTSA